MKTNSFIIKLLSLMTGLFFFSSCKKFLEEPPSKTSSLVVKTTAQINAVLDRQNSFFSEPNRTNVFSTDDFGQTVALFNGGRSVLNSVATVQFMLWDTQYLPDNGRETFWSGEFSKIFLANLALNEVDDAAGTEEEKTFIKADAHFIRAYSYWELANTYCLPFTEANKNEIGLPIKTSTSFEEPFERQSLEKVYSLIEADLAEALKTTVSITQTGKVRSWRASKASVNAFAARYYLNRNNYAKAIEHANAALADYNVLVDYNSEMRYGRDDNVIVNGQTVTLKYPYTANNQIDNDQTDLVAWKELLYMRLLKNETSWFIPSQELLNLYDKTNDLRYEYHMVEQYSYRAGMVSPAYDYPGYVFFFRDNLISGPTVAEVLLTKAEAQARTNDFAGAMTTVNILRAKRMKPGAWVNLSATVKDDAIKKVLEERRREMPFAQRWFDIRRYNNNDDPNDDVTLTRTFYPYSGTSILVNETPRAFTLPKNSRRFAAPIPNTEIISSNGVIKQNTY